MHGSIMLADDDDEITRKHLTSIYHGLRKYMIANNGMWPQRSLELGPEDEQRWWIETLSPYGVTEQDWTDPRHGNVFHEDGMSYGLADFNDRPNTAYRWPTQPWVMTVGPSKGTGQLHLLLPDGRVVTQEELSQITRTVKSDEYNSNIDK